MLTKVHNKLEQEDKEWKRVFQGLIQQQLKLRREFSVVEDKKKHLEIQLKNYHSTIYQARKGIREHQEYIKVEERKIETTREEMFHRIAIVPECTLVLEQVHYDPDYISSKEVQEASKQRSLSFIIQNQKEMAIESITIISNGILEEDWIRARVFGDLVESEFSSSFSPEDLIDHEYIEEDSREKWFKLVAYSVYNLREGKKSLKAKKKMISSPYMETFDPTIISTKYKIEQLALTTRLQDSARKIFKLCNEMNETNRTQIKAYTQDSSDQFHQIINNVNTRKEIKDSLEGDIKILENEIKSVSKRIKKLQHDEMQIKKKVVDVLEKIKNHVSSQTRQFVLSGDLEPGENDTVPDVIDRLIDHFVNNVRERAQKLHYENIKEVRNSVFVEENDYYNKAQSEYRAVSIVGPYYIKRVGRPRPSYGLAVVFEMSSTLQGWNPAPCWTADGDGCEAGVAPPLELFQPLMVRVIIPKGFPEIQFSDKGAILGLPKGAQHAVRIMSFQRLNREELMLFLLLEKRDYYQFYSTQIGFKDKGIFKWGDLSQVVLQPTVSTPSHLSFEKLRTAIPRGQDVVFEMYQELH
ncbi:MAG: hypothetical protein H8E41_14365 [Desulfobulbaceae bacterium]|uniref:Uncharacterized protein n=1 Tax=Candidatus Desulfobia pelagia TaxID=2841692 RepID=A0A8J6NHD2_9BACT|nr:hypothetical protein [Candidatus Desulfobia pelagia]